MDRYIVDYMSESAKVIIELDGGQHATQTEQDATRTQTLESMGYVVLRFWNNDVLKNTDGVLTEIRNTIRQNSDEQPLSQRERGLG